MVKAMFRCFTKPALFIVSQSDPCPGESVVALPGEPWKKSPSRCTTLSTDCTNKTRGMSLVRQWRQRQRKRFADDGDSIPPEGRSPLHPLAFKECPLWYSLFQKERAALRCKKSPVACKARVKPVKRGPILAWYLCLFVQKWSWHGRCKEN